MHFLYFNHSHKHTYLQVSTFNHTHIYISWDCHCFTNTNTNLQVILYFFVFFFLHKHLINNHLNQPSQFYFIVFNACMLFQAWMPHDFFHLFLNGHSLGFLSPPNLNNAVISILVHFFLSLDVFLWHRMLGVGLLSREIYIHLILKQLLIALIFFLGLGGCEVISFIAFPYQLIRTSFHVCCPFGASPLEKSHLYPFLCF